MHAASNVAPTPDMSKPIIPPAAPVDMAPMEGTRGQTLPTASATTTPATGSAPADGAQAAETNFWDGPDNRDPRWDWLTATHGSLDTQGGQDALRAAEAAKAARDAQTPWAYGGTAGSWDERVRESEAVNAEAAAAG